MNDYYSEGEVVRLARERDFHNERFDGGGREEQMKFYAALKACDSALHGSVLSRSAGADVLDYGCATGDWSVSLAPSARTVMGIDISDVAIEQARLRATSAALSNVQFAVADAMATGLADASFDLVYGSGIIHHLDTERSLRELHRVLRPGGSAIFKEPLGHNWLINGYRRKTPEARTVDEHPLLRQDIAIARRYFDVSLRFYGFATLGAVPFHNRPRARDTIYPVLERADRLLLSLPGLRWQAWHVLLDLRKRA